MSSTIQRIVERLLTGDAVAVVGAGVSASFTDHAGHTHAGIPMAAGLAANLKKIRPYAENATTLADVAMRIATQERPHEMRHLLVDQIAIPQVLPLPAHKWLSKLPFSCYVSFNFDELLETELEKASRDPVIVYNDHHLAKIGKARTAVIKPHGTISNEESLCVLPDETVDISFKNPLIADYLRTTFAFNIAVYLGFSLKDPDFVHLHFSLRNRLQDQMPNAVAVVQNATKAEIDFWAQHGIEVIDSDLNDFLMGLANQFFKTKDVNIAQDDWLAHPYFRKCLMTVGPVPSETQVIDYFLNGLIEDIDAERRDFQQIRSEAVVLASQVVKAKPLFGSFPKVAKFVSCDLQDVSDFDDARLAIRNYVEDRDEKTKRIKRSAAEVLSHYSAIAIFSQSIRVSDALKYVPRSRQRATNVFVLECRTKSPVPFYDAVRFIEPFAGETEYNSINIVTDMSFHALVRSQRVECLAMGAHRLLKSDGHIVGFVNTTGTAMLCEAARNLGIPVIVVAEAEKISDDGIKVDQVSRELPNLAPVLSDLKTKSHAIPSGTKVLNFDYDYIEDCRGVIFVTEDGPIHSAANA